MALLKPNPIKATRFDTKPEAFQVYTERQLDKIDALTLLTAAQRFEMSVVAHVLPFRVNRYVIDNLIDWRNIPVRASLKIRILSQHFFARAAFCLKL